MRYKKSMLSVLCALGLLAAAAGAQAEGWCESGKAVNFAGLNWESGTRLTELMQFVLAKGYGCTTD
ncbi:histidine ABC transporter substrate-binding protein, partial [Pseudomonas aeruginosa]|nr:histidine ABC transporter substrate-binding protein [Pseudomonas aeruginosa]